ncbi:SPOR domain-containing protein [Candidatus Accumulibacter sp. ACC007]|uniref:SPOR domain-containing protein n=1 Tax=Candidatus Accumulibacter sp. ACC007 TaxID=2823333 RepID=UPI0025C13624|nr:SPOR domain-containing protein [Candidatus Accumulibacter sp. ACC007]
MAARHETKAKAGASRAEVAPAAGTAQPAGEARADLKRQLLWRMGLAGLMILALLGVLALFDYANAPDDSLVTGQPYTEPVPVRKKDPVLPLTPAETPLDAPPVTTESATTEVSSEVASEVDSEAGSESAARKTAGASVQTRPLSKAGATAGEKPSALSAPPPPPPPRVAATPALPPAVKKPGDGTASAAAPPPPVVEAPAPVAVRLVSGYIVESGLFSDLALAEEWQTRLAQEGIPATVEARLQIGPFKSRAEAEAARRKLGKLGIDVPSTVHRIGKP